MNGTGGMKTIGSEAGTNQITQSPSFNTYVSWVKNNHTYKFGSEFRTEGYPPTVDANTDGVYTFSAAETGQPFQTAPVNGANVGFAYASFLLGVVDTVRMDNPTHPRMGKKQFGIYAQDTWKVTRKFTLDYGLRSRVARGTRSTTTYSIATRTSTFRLTTSRSFSISR